MSKKTKKKDLSPLARFMNEMHEGDLLNKYRQLNYAIYLLHFLPEEEIDRFEVQNTCYFLMGLNEVFLEMYCNKIGVSYMKMNV